MKNRINIYMVAALLAAGSVNTFAQTAKSPISVSWQRSDAER